MKVEIINGFTLHSWIDGKEIKRVLGTVRKITYNDGRITIRPITREDKENKK
jgi:hypothetical protein